MASTHCGKWAEGVFGSITTRPTVKSLSNSDMNINLGILETAPSIFREWHARSG